MHEGPNTAPAVDERPRTPWARVAAVVRDLLIATPPIAAFVAYLAATAYASGSTGDTDRAWAPLVWPWQTALWSFPLAVAALVATIVMRRLPRRRFALTSAWIIVALGAWPTFSLVQVALQMA